MNFDYRGTVRTGSIRGVEGIFYEDSFKKYMAKTQKNSPVNVLTACITASGS